MGLPANLCLADVLHWLDKRIDHASERQKEAKNEFETAAITGALKAYRQTAEIIRTHEPKSPGTVEKVARSFGVDVSGVELGQCTISVDTHMVKGSLDVNFSMPLPDVSEMLRVMHRKST